MTALVVFTYGPRLHGKPILSLSLSLCKYISPPPPPPPFLSFVGLFLPLVVGRTVVKSDLEIVFQNVDGRTDVTADLTAVFQRVDGWTAVTADLTAVV